MGEHGSAEAVFKIVSAMALCWRARCRAGNEREVEQEGTLRAWANGGARRCGIDHED